MLLPTSWVRELLTNYPFLLGGGYGNDMQKELSAFWALYKFVQPGHEVYKKDPSQLAFTLPLLLHGDEGRYLKKANYMVCMLECVLGSDPGQSTPGKKCRAGSGCHCAQHAALQRFGDLGEGFTECILPALATAKHQQVNDSGNEYLSKFYLFGMPSYEYKKERGLLQAAFERVAVDMQSLFEVGVDIDGTTYFGATLGVKGDLKFHHQMGPLTRSYFNVGTKANHPICSLCMAGLDGVPFEDVSPSAAWLQTVFQEKPWEDGCTPALAKIPFETGCEEAIFRLDLSIAGKWELAETWQGAL